MIDLSNFSSIIKDIASYIKGKEDPVRFIRSLESPGFIKRNRIRKLIRKYITAEDDEDLLIESLGYLISLMTDEQIKELVDSI